MTTKTRTATIAGIVLAAVAAVNYFRDAPDHEKIEAYETVAPELSQGAVNGHLIMRPSVVHICTFYGQVRARGGSHEEGLAEIDRIATGWAAGELPPGPPDVLPLGDEEILRLVNETDRVQEGDWGGHCDLGYQYGSRRQAGMSVQRSLFESGEWIVRWYGGENPWNQPVPSLYALSVDGSRLYLRTVQGLYDMREVSSFALQSRMMRGEGESHVRPLLREYRDLRFTQTRVFLTLAGDYWTTQNPIGYSLESNPNHPGWWENLDALIDMHEEEGLYVRLVILGALEPFGGTWERGVDIYNGEVRRKAEMFAEAVVRRYAGRPHILFEYTNEPAQIGMNRSSQAIGDMVCQLKNLAPSNMFNAGDVTYMDIRQMVRCADFADEHLPRNSGIQFLESVKRMGENHVRDNPETGGTLPSMSGEPFNMGEARVDGRTDDTATEPITAFAYGAVMRVRQMMSNFHYDGGLWSISPKPDTRAMMEAYHAGLDAIPMLTGRRWRGTQGYASDPINYWDYRMNPDSDDIRTVEDHVQRGRGPWRAYGVEDYSVVFPESPSWDFTTRLRAPASRVAHRANSVYRVSVYRRQ